MVQQQHHHHHIGHSNRPPILKLCQLDEREHNRRQHRTHHWYRRHLIQHHHHYHLHHLKYHQHPTVHLVEPLVSLRKLAKQLLLIVSIKITRIIEYVSVHFANPAHRTDIANYRTPIIESNSYRLYITNYISRYLFVYSPSSNRLNPLYIIREYRTICSSAFLAC